MTLNGEQSAFCGGLLHKDVSIRIDSLPTLLNEDRAARRGKPTEGEEGEDLASTHNC